MTSNREQRSEASRMGLTLMLLTALISSCSEGGQQPQRAQKVMIESAELAGQTNKYEYPGRVEAASEVNMSFMVSGTLSNVKSEGTHLNKGDVVAEMDARDYKLQMSATEAEYEQVKAEAERVMALWADSVVTAEDYDKARYGLQQITAKRDNARNQLNYTKIYAPFACTVQSKLMDAPTVVGAGMPVVTVVSDGTQEIEISIPASVYMNRQNIKGFSTRFSYAPQTEVTLRLISISPKANANQLHTVRLGIPSDLKPQPSAGMSTMVTMEMTELKDVRSLQSKTESKDDEVSGVEVTSTAVFNNGGQSYVWVYDPASGVVTKRAVSVARLLANGRTVIALGLSQGEQVVTMGVHKIVEGQSVEPMQPKSETNIGGLL